MPLFRAWGRQPPDALVLGRHLRCGEEVVEIRGHLVVDVLDGADGEFVELAAPVLLRVALPVRQHDDGGEDSGVQIVIGQDAVIDRRERVVQLGGADRQDVRARGGQCSPGLFREFVLGRTAQQLRPHQTGDRLLAEGTSTALGAPDDQPENVRLKLAVLHARSPSGV
ncbi:hypothetical protein [Streptomyces fuscichromogenes]|uniref:Uncharacterized protein n=1 Tax=Streptomyces fuscichromogenes TaxID=1324013 RepID=A0A917UKC2_9ACTN|nr:hypothetical protein [Streptomyces fuscichromogenes]GGM94530.1 hypothetical protein GCM10011578_013500 [Streptomyces fuscichromogenes]